jgi:uncharacterized delta-60 repeat protein
MNVGLQSFLLGLLAGAASHISAAQQGIMLDTTFSHDGLANIHFSTGHDVAYSIAVQSDGRIVVAGTADNGNDLDFALARYDSAGTLDVSFGNGGTTVNGTPGDDWFGCVAIQTDGRIVAVGGTNTPPGSDFAVARYNSDGSLDSSFGVAGQVITDVADHDQGIAVVIQTDGRIVLAGSSASASNRMFVLVRYNADGSIDSSFGTSGITMTDIGSDEWCYDLAIQTDGKLIAVGQTSVVDGDFVIARYLPNGRADSSFGGTGVIATDFANSNDYGYGVVVQPDGRIVVAGCSDVWAGPPNYNYDFALVRYNTDGSIDSSFGGVGWITTDISVNVTFAYEVALQADGRIVVAGYAHNPVPPPNEQDFCLVRYNPDGTLDSTFTLDGIVMTDFGLGDDDVAYAVEIQADGKIVAAGGTDNGHDFDFGIARYRASCPSTTISESISACSPVLWNGNTLSASGTYFDTLLNAAGCDSLTVLDLEINSVQATITQTDNTLTATDSGASYQWVECSHGWYMPIVGATNQSFTPSVSGIYAVIVTMGPCSDTSDCIALIVNGHSGHWPQGNVQVYPSPTSGNLVVDLGEFCDHVAVEVSDATGRLLQRVVRRQTHLIDIRLDAGGGVYLIQVHDGEGEPAHFKVVKY